MEEKDENILRYTIRKAICEAVNNYLKHEPATHTKQLNGSTEGKIIGDPISDVKMNQQADNLGSDGKNAPTVSVKPGAAKGGTDFTAGQRAANFSDKTEQAK